MVVGTDLKKMGGVVSGAGRGSVPFVSLLVMLCSCATAYRPAKNGADTGYSESQMALDQFQVTFQGNAHTSLEQANDFALLRCAEIARQHRFNCFAVIDTINTSSAK